VPKSEPTLGNPNFHHWSRQFGHPLFDHPKTRILIRVFENSPSAGNTLFPGALSSAQVAALGYDNDQTIAWRIFEGMQYQIAQGASPASLGMFRHNEGGFVQNNNPTETAKPRGTVHCFRSMLDAVSGGFAPQESIFAAKARNGPNALFPALQTIYSASVARAGYLAGFLEDADIEAIGYDFGDMEQGPQPWQWYMSGGGPHYGTWAAHLSDPRFSTEIIMPAAFAVVGGFSDMTLQDVVAEIIARRPNFQPRHDKSWGSVPNVEWIDEFCRMRQSFMNCHYAAAIVVPWKLNPVFAATKFGNYDATHASNPAVKTIYRFDSFPERDHNIYHFGMDTPAPVWYFRTNGPSGPAPGLARFALDARFDTGVLYDRKAGMAMIRAQNAAIEASEGPQEQTPWLRGIDALSSNPPAPSVDDLARQMRVCRYINCLNGIIWSNDGAGPRFDDMLLAQQKYDNNDNLNGGLPDFVFAAPRPEHLVTGVAMPGDAGILTSEDVLADGVLRDSEYLYLHSALWVHPDCDRFYLCYAGEDNGYAVGWHADLFGNGQPYLVVVLSGTAGLRVMRFAVDLRSGAGQIDLKALEFRYIKSKLAQLIVERTLVPIASASGTDSGILAGEGTAGVGANLGTNLLLTAATTFPAVAGDPSAWDGARSLVTDALRGGIGYFEVETRPGMADIDLPLVDSIEDLAAVGRSDWVSASSSPPSLGGFDLMPASLAFIDENEDPIVGSVAISAALGANESFVLRVKNVGEIAANGISVDFSGIVTVLNPFFPVILQPGQILSLACSASALVAGASQAGSVIVSFQGGSATQAISLTVSAPAEPIREVPLATVPKDAVIVSGTVTSGRAELLTGTVRFAVRKAASGLLEQTGLSVSLVAERTASADLAASYAVSPGDTIVAQVMDMSPDGLDIKASVGLRPIRPA
jgi:hypothetical protein